MAITTLDEVLEFCGIETAYFIITPANNTMNFTSSSGGPVNIVLADGNYNGVSMASHLQTQMNADTTLTGAGTITFIVSYDATTRKFTIDAGTGKTILFTSTSSNAGYTLGFTSDKVAAQTITSDISASDPTQIISILKDASEEFVSSYCNRTFEETSYKFERYDGNNKQLLYLRQFPVTAVDRVAIGLIDVVNIRNTNTSSVSTVSVTNTGLRLVLDGVADTTVTFAANTTMTAIVDAVNALGNGWEAQLCSSIYGNYKSTELVPKYGSNCINNNWVPLRKTDIPLDDFDVYLERGQIFRYAGWPTYLFGYYDRCFENTDNIYRQYINSVGSRNIYIDYTAGYTTDTMPSDLKLAIKILVKYYYNKRDDESFGYKDYRAHNIWAGFDKDETFPKEVKDIISGYRRIHT